MRVCREINSFISLVLSTDKAGGARDTTNMQNYKSNLRGELTWRRIEKRIKLPVFLGMICWSAYICLEVKALAYEVIRPIIVL